jgi:hypothetical protein
MARRRRVTVLLGANEAAISCGRAADDSAAIGRFSPAKPPKIRGTIRGETRRSSSGANFSDQQQCDLLDISFQQGQSLLSLANPDFRRAGVVAGGAPVPVSLR